MGLPVVTEEHFVFFSSSDASQVVNGSVVSPAAPVAGTAEVTLNFGPAASDKAPATARRKRVMLWSIDEKRANGGSATNHQPQVADAAGAATTDWSVKYLGTATAPGTRIDVFSIGKPMYTDTAGKLYYQPNGDAADTFNYTLCFKVLG